MGRAEGLGYLSSNRQSCNISVLFPCVCVGGKVWGKVVVQDVVNVGNNWEPRRCEGLFEHNAAY